MDELFHVCIELIALRGSEGCTLKQLWNILGTRSSSNFSFPLSNDVKQMLWSSLVASVEDISFFLQGSTEGWENVDSSCRQPQTLERGAESLLSLSSAEDAEVYVLASEELQSNAIGLYDANLTRFQLSDIQRKTLALLGTAGPQGMLQNELADTLNQDNRNYFYVIKNLEQRGLLCKRIAFVRTDKQTSYFNGGKVQTNLVHLTRFAPELNEEVILTDGACHSHHGHTVMDIGEEELGQMDDRIQFRRVCEQLRGQVDKCAAEADLKRALGYQKQKGHRMWRRIKNGMQRKGLIEEFVATQDDKRIKVIKLLKDADSDDENDTDATEEGDENEDANEEEVANGLAGNQVAELSLDRQLFQLVIKAGYDGVNASEIESYLALNIKRGSSRFKEMEKRFNIKSVMVTQGKSSMSRYIADHDLLQQHRHTVAPLVPKDGWLGAVEDAITAGLEAGDSFPIATSNGKSTQEQAGGTGNFNCGNDQVVTGAFQDPAQQIDFATVRKSNAAGTSMPLENTSEVGQMSGQPTTDAKSRVPVNRGMPFLQACRVRWLVERVAAEGFMLAAEMPRYFKDCEQQEGNLHAVIPDRKTCNRVIEKAQAGGSVQVVQIALPTKKEGLHARSHIVIIRPGLNQGPDFVEQVYTRYKSLHTRIRLDASTSKMQETEGVYIPEIQLQPLIPARQLVSPQSLPKIDEPEKFEKNSLEGEQDSRSNATARIMLKNGFQPAKALRCKQLHGLLLAMVDKSARKKGDLQTDLAKVFPTDESGGTVVTPVTQELPKSITLSADEAAKSDFIVTAVPGDGNAPSRMNVQAMLCDDPQRRCTLTRVDIWESLTVKQWLEIVGCTQQDTEWVQELSQTGKRIRELSVQDQLILFDNDITRPLSRLNLLVDILGRMGLLSSVIPVGPTARLGMSGIDATMYVVQLEAAFQEPTNQHILGDNKFAIQTRRITHTYDLTSLDGFNRYWSRLEYNIINHADPGLNKTRLSASNSLRFCFPIDRVPEFGHSKSWASASSLSAEDWGRVHKLLGDQDPKKLSADAAWDASVTLGLSFSSVLSFIKERRRKSRLGRLGGRRLGLEGLGAVTANQTVSVTKESLSSPLSKNLKPFSNIGYGKRKIGNAVGVFGRHSGKIEAGEDVDSDGGCPEAVHVDRQALMAHKASPIRRKARWHKHEDRQLLVAWAGWVAQNGMDRMLLWRQVKCRPALRTATCKHRLRQLMRHDVAGPLLHKVREIADGVYAKRVLDCFDADRHNDVVGPQEILSCSFEGATKTKLSRSSPSPSSDDNAHLKKSRRGNSSYTNIHTHGSTLESLPVLTQLFLEEPHNATDDIKRVANLIEKVIEAAPKRYKEHREQTGRRPGPRQGFKQLRSEVANLAGKDTKSRELLCQWAASDETSAESCPSLAAFTAGELIKSLLHIGLVQGTIGPGSELALIKRFTEDEIKGAFALLHGQGIINKVFGKQRSLQLSDYFQKGLQVTGFQQSVFKEVEQFISFARHMPNLQIYGNDSHQEMDGGAVAFCLEQMAQGCSTLRLADGHAETEPEHSNPASSSMYHTSLSEVSLPVNIKLEQEIMLGKFSLDNLKQLMLERYTIPLLFQPSIVALSPSVREDAWNAAVNYVQQSSFQDHDEGLLFEILVQLRSRCSAGLALPEIKTIVEAYINVIGQVDLDAINCLLNTLLEHGLARRFYSWDNVPIYIASEYSQRYMAYPFIPNDNKVDESTLIQGLITSNNLPSFGGMQPCIDVPLRPWFDHFGKYNDALLKSLAQRALSVLVRHPGVTERIACSQLGVIAPPNATELFSSILRDGYCKFQCGKDKSCDVSVIEKCFSTLEKIDDHGPCCDLLGKSIPFIGISAIAMRCGNCE